MKLAVFFPGVGYHCDKPLLYYSKKLFMEYGYEIKEVNYTGFEGNIKGSAQKMKEAFECALEQSKEILADTDFTKYENIVFVMKSIGTAVGSAYAKQSGINPQLIILTPVEQTFMFVNDKSGIVFHGSSDTWAKTDIIRSECEKLELPLHILKDANHSLETGKLEIDLAYLHEVMRLIEEAIR